MAHNLEVAGSNPVPATRAFSRMSTTSAKLAFSGTSVTTRVFFCASERPAAGGCIPSPSQVSLSTAASPNSRRETVVRQVNLKNHSSQESSSKASRSRSVFRFQRFMLLRLLMAKCSSSWLNVNAAALCVLGDSRMAIESPVMASHNCGM